MKYICDCVRGTLFFDYNTVKCGCSNTGGFVFQNFDGGFLNLENINQRRKNLVENFKKGILPQVCQNCYMLNTDDFGKIDEPLKKELDNIFISHWLHCNCGCIYCCNGIVPKSKISSVKRKSEYYDLLPTIIKLCKEGYVGEHTKIHTIGGEPAVLDEFDEIMRWLRKYSKEKISFLTSGIDFSQTIYDFLKEGNASVCVSLDCGTPSLFFKIKRVDAFDKVLDNLKKYVSANLQDENSVILKYILINGLNDSVEEIDNFLNIARNLGIKQVFLDINHNVFSYNKGKKIPKHWYELFEHYQNISDLCTSVHVQCQQILDKGYIF